MENNTNNFEDMNSDISEFKPSFQATLDSGKPSSAFVIPGSLVKKETPNSCEEMADEGNNSVFADRSNRVQDKIDSSSDENKCPYSMYYKDKPELKGPITSRAQYHEYFQELKDKQRIYESLKKIQQDNSVVINKLVVDSEDAKARGDINRYNAICEQYKESHEIYKNRMEIFLVLHAELSSIKQRIEELGESLQHWRKHSGKDFHAHELSSVQKDRSHGDARNENIQATARNFTDGSNGSKLSQLGASPKDTNTRIDLNKSPNDMNSDIYLDGSNGSKTSQLGASPKDNIRFNLNKLPPEDMNLDITEGSFKHTNTSEDMNLDITKVADGVADRDNRDQQKRESSSDENHCPKKKLRN